MICYYDSQRDLILIDLKSGVVFRQAFNQPERPISMIASDQVSVLMKDGRQRAVLVAGSLQRNNILIHAALKIAGNIGRFALEDGFEWFKSIIVFENNNSY